jgi:RNA polymerase sigma-70 factor (ECF subfamily)
MLTAMKESELPDEPTDVDIDALLPQALAGDQGAFEAIYRGTVGNVYGVCLRMTAERSVAEECTQRTFVKAWQGLSDFRGDSALATWLHRIAVNEVLALGRRERRRLQHLEVPDPDLISARSQASDPASAMDLERAIGLLPERARQVFVLYGIYGHSHEDTAAMLGIAVGTSKAHYHRARELLRGALELSDE